MRAFIQRLTRPPTHPDPDQNQLARILHYTLLLGILLAGGYTLLIWPTAEDASGTIISGGITVVFVFLLLILHRGHVHLISIALILSSYLAIMISLFVNGGLRDEAGLVLIGLLAMAITTIILRQLLGQIVTGSEQIRRQAGTLQEKNDVLLATQQALIVAKEDAERANAAKSEFLSRLSHDLRTPLNSMIGFTNVLLDDPALAPKARADWLRRIQRNGEYMQRMIDDLLALSRIEAGKLQLYPVKIPLTAFLMEVVTLIQMEVQQKSFQFVYQFDEELPAYVYTDETRLRQILLNLLGNAVKFTLKGSVTFRVRPLPATPSHQPVRFEVIDTGIGIPEADLERIFEPFEQSGPEAQRNKGTGLGLAISQQLVDVLGGELQVESKVGQGSRFWFALPFPLEE